MSTFTTNQILGALITYNRTQAGMSLTQLAFQLDISYQNLWDLENDHRTVTTTRTMKIIAILNITPESYWSKTPQAINLLKQKKSTKASVNTNISSPSKTKTTWNPITNVHKMNSTKAANFSSPA